MNERFIRRKDRKLGHEWLEWDEEAKERFPSDTSAPPALWLLIVPATLLFLLFLFSLFVSLFALAIKITPPFIFIAHRLLLIFGSLLTLYFLLLIFSYFVKVDLVLFLKQRKLFAALTFSLGHLYHRLGLLSRDRLGNSLLRILNRLERGSIRSRIRNENHRILLLLPRCIEGRLREKILQRAQELNVSNAIAGDGEAARLAVQRHNPKAILAIACERDLVTGIRDVNLSIPIFCISVKRPKGPCLETSLDFAEVDNFLNLLISI